MNRVDGAGGESLWGMEIDATWPPPEVARESMKRILAAELDALRQQGRTITVDNPLLRRLECDFSNGGLEELYGELMTRDELEGLIFMRDAETGHGDTSWSLESMHIAETALSALKASLGAQALTGAVGENLAPPATASG